MTLQDKNSFEGFRLSTNVNVDVFLVGEPELNIWLCVVSGVWCPCGVPWMDAMLQSVREERQLYSHNQCVKYM